MLKNTGSPPKRHFPYNFTIANCFMFRIYGFSFNSILLIEVVLVQSGRTVKELALTSDKKVMY